jgi:hypothetical protein
MPGRGRLDRHRLAGRGQPACAAARAAGDLPRGVRARSAARGASATSARRCSRRRSSRIGTAEQQQRFLPGIRAGTEYWAQGYSEPGAGSDLANVQTRAALDETADGWVLDGQKVWTSWAQDSDWIFVLARTEPGSSVRHRGLVLLLVPLASKPGITIRPIRQMTGAAEFYEVFFDGARTEASLASGHGRARAGKWRWRCSVSSAVPPRWASRLSSRRELGMVIAAARANGAARDPLLRQRIAHSALTAACKCCASTPCACWRRTPSQPRVRR